MADSDYEAEGWAWLHDHPEAVAAPGVRREDFSWEAFERWRSREEANRVVRFELVGTCAP